MNNWSSRSSEPRFRGDDIAAKWPNFGRSRPGTAARVWLTNVAIQRRRGATKDVHTVRAERDAVGSERPPKSAQFAMNRVLGRQHPHRKQDADS